MLMVVNVLLARVASTFRLDAAFPTVPLLLIQLTPQDNSLVLPAALTATCAPLPLAV